MNDDQPTEGKATLADIVAMASHGTVRCENPADPLIHPTHEQMAMDAAMRRPRAELDHITRTRLVNAGGNLRLAQERVSACLNTGNPALIADAIAAAHSALAHLVRC
jgi:hypothetical protein